jgi:hypothetical protein
MQPLYEKFKNNGFAWFEIRQHLPTAMPEISIKRSCTDLKNEGKLIQTDVMVEGPYGKPCHRYQFNKKYNGNIISNHQSDQETPEAQLTDK